MRPTVDPLSGVDVLRERISLSSYIKKLASRVLYCGARTVHTHHTLRTAADYTHHYLDTLKSLRNSPKPGERRAELNMA